MATQALRSLQHPSPYNMSRYANFFGCWQPAHRARIRFERCLSSTRIEDRVMGRSLNCQRKAQ